MFVYDTICINDSKFTMNSHYSMKFSRDQLGISQKKNAQLKFPGNLSL